MPIGPARMPLMDHLGELRRRLTIIIVSLIVGTVVMYFTTPVLVEVLKDPILPSLPAGSDLYIMSSLGGFAIKFGLAVKISAVMCTPMIVWQILGFFLPALKPSERKWVVPTVLIATVLFFAGMLFCYFFIVPPAFEWMIAETSTIAGVIGDLENYLNTEMLLMLGFGVAFELPLIVFYLAVFHIVPYSSFRAAWRYIYVVMLVVSASITPDASPVTLLFMYAVMLSLYEAALLVTRFVVMARDGKEGLTASRLSLFGDDEDEE